MRIFHIVAYVGICVIPLATILSVNYLYEANRENAYYLDKLNSRLAAFQEQLNNLSILLKEYKNTHKDYPLNNEGLVDLNNFESWYKIYFPILNADDGYANLGISIHEKDDELKQIVDNQRSERERSCWPRQDFVVRITSEYTVFSELAEYTMGIRKDGISFIWEPIGPVDRWSLMPYLYENRSGLASSAFEGSVVNKDNANDYSLCVDEGVYVYSIAAMNEAQICGRLKAEMTPGKTVSLIIIIIGAGILMFFLLRWLLSVDGKCVYLWITFLVFISALLILFLVAARRPQPFVNNYVYANVNRIYVRTSEVVDQQKEMLALYRKNNIITQETYDKHIKALELSPTIDADSDN